MCNSTNTTTSSSSTSLPGGLTDAINSASSGALAAYRAGNPTAGMVQPVAPLNDWQNQAAGTTAGLAGYQPQQITPGSVTRYGSPTVSGDQIQSYMNPYTSSVINTSLDELNRQLAITNQTADGQAAQAGAFGGDRAAIVGTENARNANSLAAQTIAGLNSQNYGQAAALAEQDASRSLQAGTAQSDLEANAQRSNQQAGLAGAQLNLAAANQEGYLGSQFRQATQDNLNSGYQAAYRDAYWPVTSLSTLTGQLGQLASAAPRTTNTSQTVPGQSYIGQAAGLGTALLGANQLVPGGLASAGSSLWKGLFGGSSSSYDPSALGYASGVDASGALTQGGQDLASLGLFNSISGYARGGLASYADGGEVDDEPAGTVDPATGMYVPPIPIAPRRPPMPLGLAAATVNPAAPTGAGAPVAAGPDATANLGLAAAAPTAATSSAVDQALAVNPAAIVAGRAQPDKSIPIDQMPASDSQAGASPDAPSQPASGGLAGASLSLPAIDVTAPAPEAKGLAAAQPDDRITRSASPSSPLPTYGQGLAAAAPTPDAPQGDWTNNKLGMTLLNSGLAMMASRSTTALGAIGEGGLAGVRSLGEFEANRAAQMKNDLTAVTLPSTIQALTGAGQPSGVTDPGQAEVLRLRALASRFTAAGDGKSATAINNQLLEIARDGRVTGADGRVYAVPNARQLAFGVNADKELAGVPAKTILSDHDAENTIRTTGVRQAGEAAGAEPINMTVQDANGNPTNVVIPRSQWRNQNLAAGMTSPDQFLASLIGRENPGGDPAQKNLAGSSAMGNGQFLSGTYLPLFKASFPQAAAKMSDGQILATRANPQIAGEMVLRNAQQNKAALEARGVPGTGAALGLAHQFGADGALKIAQSPANTPVNVALGIPADDPIIKQNRLQGVTTGQIATTMAKTYGTNVVGLPGAGGTPGAAAPPGTPPGTIMGAPYLSPEQKAQGEERAKQYASVAEAGRNVPEQMIRLDMMQRAFNDFRTGTTGPGRAASARVIADGFSALGMTPPEWAVNDAANADLIEKEGGFLANSLTKALGSREAASVFNQQKSITPNLSMSNGGFQLLINSLRQEAQRNQDLANFQDDWLADPKNHNSIAGMQQAFNKEFPREVYSSRIIPLPFKNDTGYLKDGVAYRMGDGSVGVYNATRRGFMPAAGS